MNSAYAISAKTLLPPLPFLLPQCTTNRQAGGWPAAENTRSLPTLPHFPDYSVFYGQARYRCFAFLPNSLSSACILVWVWAAGRDEGFSY